MSAAIANVASALDRRAAASELCVALLVEDAWTSHGDVTFAQARWWGGGLGSKGVRWPERWPKGDDSRLMGGGCLLTLTV